MVRRALAVITLVMCALLVHLGHPGDHGALPAAAVERSESRVHDRAESEPDGQRTTIDDDAPGDRDPAGLPWGHQRFATAVGTPGGVPPVRSARTAGSAPSPAAVPALARTARHKRAPGAGHRPSPALSQAFRC